MVKDATFAFSMAEISTQRDSEAPAQRILFPIPYKNNRCYPCYACGGVIRLASQSQERILATLKSLATAAISRHVWIPCFHSCNTSTLLTKPTRHKAPEGYW